MNAVFIAIIVGLQLGLALCLWWYERLCGKNKKEIEHWKDRAFREGQEIDRLMRLSYEDERKHKENLDQLKEQLAQLQGELKTLHERLKKRLLKALPGIIFEISRELFSDMYANQRAEKLSATIVEKMKKELGE